MTSKLVQFTFNNNSTIFEIVNFFLCERDRGKRRSIWRKMRRRRRRVRNNSGKRRRSRQNISGGKGDLTEGWMLSGIWDTGASSCMRSRFKMLLASSEESAEFGVCHGKRRAIEREEKENETDRSLLLCWARWEVLGLELLLTQLELEADRSLDFERDRERERELAALGLERRGG
ncbi:hypothetical protein RhiirA5_385097 [Rhizophagus irregularis]|uniref:Uncharacterized protein n=1 Tax=Rhizophagus irregularis TaxID=588596 RepID=A0A2I1FEP4_9GLOM|nr:hypothetical protein RhiirA5_385097 [Rhizophagus irregularis]PKC57273.1 hypothetical protein RhiirA1_401527 [Rhizophagus irregularis]PKY32862.1 hypothetical protein RhiirB3_394347 [Rhizophagus irregularis]